MATQEVVTSTVTVYDITVSYDTNEQPTQLQVRYLRTFNDPNSEQTWSVIVGPDQLPPQNYIALLTSLLNAMPVGTQ